MTTDERIKVNHPEHTALHDAQRPMAANDERGRVWRVRWRQGGRTKARTFSTMRDARDFAAKVTNGGVG